MERPAAGYRVSGVRADPQTLTVSGEAAAVERLSSISTQPLDISGVTGDVDQTVAADLPAGVSPVAATDVRLLVTVEPDVGSRTWQVGVQVQGARATRQYVLSTPTVLVTMSGAQPDLDAVDPSTIEAHIAVGRLAPGTHEVDVVVEPLDGLDLVSVAPDDRACRSVPRLPAECCATSLDVARPGRIRRGVAAMTRLFGTDGIRGLANVDLKPTLAFALGRATAWHLLGGNGQLLVGQDTRRSGDMLVAGLVCGATSMGVDVHRLGVCPTPALSFVTGDLGYGAGIMVSASHNPADDNGLKVLDGRGLKLDDQSEEDLEALLWRADELPSPTNSGIGRETDGRPGLDRYRQHRLALARRTASDLRRDPRLRQRVRGRAGARHPCRDRGPGQRPLRCPRRQQHQPWLRCHGTRGTGAAHGPGRVGCRLRPRWRRGPVCRGRRAGHHRGRGPAAGHHRPRPACPVRRWRSRPWS